MSYDVYDIMVRLVFYLVCISFRSLSISAAGRSSRDGARVLGRQKRYNIIITDGGDDDNNNNNNMVIVPVRYKYAYARMLYSELCD